VTVRRVERAKQFLEGGGDFSRAEVAARTGSRTRTNSPTTSGPSSESRRASSVGPQESRKDRKSL